MHDSSSLFDDASALLASASSGPDRREIAAELFKLAGICARFAARVEGRRKRDLIDAVIDFPTLKRDALAQLDAVKSENFGDLTIQCAEMKAIEPPSFEALERARWTSERKRVFVAQLSGDLARMGRAIRTVASRLHTTRPECQ